MKSPCQSLGPRQLCSMLKSGSRHQGCGDGRGRETLLHACVGLQQCHTTDFPDACHCRCYGSSHRGQTRVLCCVDLMARWKDLEGPHFLSTYWRLRPPDRRECQWGANTLNIGKEKRLSHSTFQKHLTPQNI